VDLAVELLDITVLAIGGAIAYSDERVVVRQT